MSYGQRPSAVLGLEPASWEAYQLDVATLQLGRWVEGKLSERDEKGKPVWTLERLLNGETGEQREFAALKGKATRTVQIRPDGTWDD